jgi:acetyl esterase/lipase
MGGSPRDTGPFSNWPPVLASFAARGYLIASVDHRLSIEADSPAAIQDVKSAIRWIHANADSLDVDRSRGLAWGSSAGGPCANLAGTSCGVTALEPATRDTAAMAAAAVESSQGPPPSTESDCVQGVVSWYG